MVNRGAVVAILALTLWMKVKGHGRLLVPPSRASMWREGFNTPKNYNDNQLFCGGFYNQQSHGGKCGVCGDPWQGPRDHEAGGKYATGTIGATYSQGQKVTVTVAITANHLGWFEFRLCPVNDMKVRATQACLDSNLLALADGSGTRYPIGSASKRYHVDVILPSKVSCSQCVLQWKYHTGNSWGTDPDGRGCTGCGPQEEFYGCSDIAILSRTQPTTTMPTPSSSPFTFTPTSTSTTTTTTTSTHSTPTTTCNPQATSCTQSDSCAARAVTADDIVSSMWCSGNCASGRCKQVLVCVDP
ncbi:uncharacterized protein LOC124264736 [Haliotis rubra]|uniref:uncharacterized protein LOC124264736 n=1 Tax=Haliotis rubra TaxID=36100 RepID=UPI001EE52CBE|nr:uncharacterized protein LOC124264736 [Haliotis rubra]